MRIITAEVRNFSSYKELVKNFTQEGLTLVSGPTGSGKSTMCDVIPWILFGVTAKGGAVDEVRSWKSQEDTTGVLHIKLDFSELVVHRIRGKSNDLYYHYGDFQPIRGKDLKDTQQLINHALGMDADLYLASSYFHEFSQTASFFTATAKNRREITEQLVDLSLATNLDQSSKAKLKEYNSKKVELEAEMKSLNDKVSYLISYSNSITDSEGQWEVSRTKKLKVLEKLSKDFETNKQKDIDELICQNVEKIATIVYDINDLTASIKDDSYYNEGLIKLKEALELLGDETCPTCGAKKDSSQRMSMQKRIYELELDQAENNRRKIQLVRLQQTKEKQEAANISSLDKEKSRANTYASEIEELKAQDNPYTGLLNDSKEDLQSSVNRLATAEQQYSNLSSDIADIELLRDIIAEFRSTLVKNTINELEKNTNNLLDKYFDAEIRVRFSASDADKLEVSITKDGNQAVFTQLSKGQRQLLKLCFGVSVMKSIALHHNVNTNILFFDESMDGLSEALKEKAFGMFQALSKDYESVFVVDHSEGFKVLFDRRYEVSLINGESQIEEM